jgi:hypothetical protein
MLASGKAALGAAVDEITGGSDDENEDLEESGEED